MTHGQELRAAKEGEYNMENNNEPRELTQEELDMIVGGYIPA